MGPGLNLRGNKAIPHKTEEYPYKLRRIMEDRHHRSLYPVDRALAHHPTDQEIDSIRIFIPVYNRFGPLVNIHNDDDCSCGNCNNCIEYELDDYILYYNDERFIKGNITINNNNDVNYSNKIPKSKNNIIYDNTNTISNINNVCNNNNNCTNHDHNIMEDKIELNNADINSNFSLLNEDDVNYMREINNSQDYTYTYTYVKNKKIKIYVLVTYVIIYP